MPDAALMLLIVGYVMTMTLSLVELARHDARHLLAVRRVELRER